MLISSSDVKASIYLEILIRVILRIDKQCMSPVASPCRARCLVTVSCKDPAAMLMH